MADSDNPDCLAMLGMPYDDKPTMKECMKFITRYTPLWYEIGIELGLKEALLDVIKLDHYMKHRECFRVTLQKWLEQNSRANWKTLELAITNAKRQAGSLQPLTMEEMLQKLEAAHRPPVQEGFSISAPVQEQVNKVEAVQEHRNGAHKQIDGRQEKENGAAVIEPETAPTVDRGKGMVKDVVFAETKKAICRINSPIMTGTGFLGYAKCDEGKFCTVLVTNNHVITNFDDAMGSRFVFENVYADRKITLRGSEIFKQGFFQCSPMLQLDYAMMEVDESKLVDPTTNKSLDINPFQMIRPVDIHKEGDQIYVIQHPRGEQLAFSSSNSVVQKPLLLYQCTTDYGSSGSPVLKEVDGELRVVALHRGGRDSGDSWLGYNCGTLIQEILNHLHGKPSTPLPNNNSVQEVLKKISK